MAEQDLKAQFDIRERLTDAAVSFSPIRGPNPVLCTFGIGIRSGYRHRLRTESLIHKLGDQISFFEIADMLASVEESHT